MTRILYNITKWLLKILNNRGIDVSSLTPQTDTEIKIERLTENLMILASDISIKRAGIVEEQRSLLETLEAPVFSMLSETNDSWQKTIVTKVWLDKIQIISDMIGEHEELVKKFEYLYINIEKIKKEYYES
jgi:hypothetical protein